MSTKAANTPTTITLDPTKTPDAKVLVEDGGGFIVMAIGDAVSSCALGHRMLGSIREEVEHITEFLREWNAKNTDRVAVLHVTVAPGKVMILCAPKSAEYDFELGDRLADLNMELTKAFRLFAFDSLQSPFEGFGAFVEFTGEKPPHAE